MLANIQSFSFFTLTPIADTLSYLSGYAILEQEGLEGPTTFLLKEICRHCATLLIIDGAARPKRQPHPAMTGQNFCIAFMLPLRLVLIFQLCSDQMPAYEHSSDEPEQAMVRWVDYTYVHLLHMCSLRELQVLRIPCSQFTRACTISTRLQKQALSSTHELRQCLLVTDALNEEIRQ